ncbi:hypothetical protein CLU81_1976 [Flavobacterium sp. 9]|uniref:hypothetical protein n=1 Tax=Flavobacterium sp. 9 TaxID=2035198 RepID=UPI000C17A922|nr:hypothetical protein [Flavobacterium sp. 9]PIF31486.1 hypothetical protein CLU81_1976 [Flavobacterium sp. 9]
MLNLEALNSVNHYTIYLKNEGSDAKNFWCFLEKPVGVPDSAVFANSSATLNVVPDYGGTNKFVIPVQYSLAAGASNEEVGLGVQIETSIFRKAELKQTWEAKYATIPPNQGPELNLVQGQKSPDDTIALLSNNFNKKVNENGKWFSNMSFGIQTQNGFLGVTWSPSPDDQNTITPKFSFYIATGSFTNYELADISTISRKSAKVELSDFKNLEATVTLTATGDWLVTPGRV